MLQLRVRVDPRGMAMKDYSIFPKAQGLELRIQIVSSHIQDTDREGHTPSAVMQSVYYTAPAEWAACSEEELY